MRETEGIMKKKINLVTGASGFLGSHLVRELLKRGEDVRILIRPTSDISSLENEKLEIFYGCLSDPDAVDSAVKGSDRVFNCAAYVQDYGPKDAFRKANVIGVENLLNSCVQYHVSRIIHISSTDVYGFPEHAASEEESFKKRPGFRYGNSKIESEKLIWDFYDKKQIPVTVFRPATIYGPRTPLLEEMVQMMRESRYIHIGRGNVHAGLIYVDNLIEAIMLSLESESSIGEAYNIIDQENISFRQLADTLIALTGSRKTYPVIPFSLAYAGGWFLERIYYLLGMRKRPVVTRMIACLFGVSQEISTEKIQKELNWASSVSFAQAMKHIFPDS